MKSSMAIGAVLAVGAWALACGVTGDAPTPAVVPVGPAPAPVPAPVPAPAPAPAPEPAAASRCPEGVYAAPLWQGEYPGPVVNVTAPLGILARPDACDGAATTKCTVAPGLYHPWAGTTARFATVRRVVKFRLRGTWTAQTDDSATVTLKEGDEIEVLAYFGEGFCGYRVNGATLTALCPEMMTKPDQTALFEEITAPEYAEIQVVGVDCKEGHSAWIDVDDALFALPEVEEGVVVEYGRVGPAK